MIISNIEAFKSWLIDTLKTCCQADPFAVGRYVVALVKKDKPETELKAFLLDQLDIFLSKDTKSFVDLLFETLKTESYIRQRSDGQNSSTSHSKRENKTNFSPENDHRTKKEENAEVSSNFSHSSQEHERSSRSKSSITKKKEERDSIWGHSIPEEKKLSVIKKEDNQSTSHSRSREKESETSQIIQHSSHSKVDSTHGDTDYRPQKKEGIIPVFHEQSGKRCQDYDERGFCLRGDLCRFDHGKDPILVEDVSVLNFGVISDDHFFEDPSRLHSKKVLIPSPPLPPNSPPKKILPPPPPPPTSINTFMPPPPILDTVTGNCTFVPEPYNPEAPGFWGVAPPLPPPMTTPPPPLPPGVFFKPKNIKPPRTRELIGIQTVSNSSDQANDVEPVNMFSERPVENTENGNEVQGNSNEFGKRRGFDFKRLGPPRKMRRSNGYNNNNILEIRKIPVFMNNIALLNNHFSKYGHVSSLEIAYDNDPEAALVKYLDPMDAQKCYRSSSPVLNNRFIKVFYHRKKDFQQENENISKPPLAELGQSFQNNSTEASKMSDVDKTNDKEVFSLTKHSTSYSKKGNLSRTVFISPPTAPKTFATKNKTITRKIEKKELPLEKRLELLRKKQDFLKTQIDHQKVVLDKLMKSKNAKEIEFLKQTMDGISPKISSLEEEIKKESEALKNILLFKTVQGVTKTEAEKKLLDAEMDLYRAASKRELLGQKNKDETAQLLSRVRELQKKAKAYIDGSSTSVGSAHKISKLRKNYLVHSSHSIDHRPRKSLDSQSSVVQSVDCCNDDMEMKNPDPEIAEVFDEEEEDEEEGDSEARSWRH